MKSSRFTRVGTFLGSAIVCSPEMSAELVNELGIGSDAALAGEWRCLTADELDRTPKDALGIAIVFVPRNRVILES